MTGNLSVIGRMAIRCSRRSRPSCTAGSALGALRAATVGRAVRACAVGRAVLVMVGLGRQPARFGTRPACSAPIIRTATAPGQEQGCHRCTHHRCRSCGFDQHVLYCLLFAKETARPC